MGMRMGTEGNLDGEPGSRALEGEESPQDLIVPFQRLLCLLIHLVPSRESRPSCGGGGLLTNEIGKA